MMKYFTYILQSEKDTNFYVGFTTDLIKRRQEHNNGNVASTRNRRPLKLIYYEVCFNQQDATHREKYLKKYLGRLFLKNRLKSYLIG